MTEKSRVESFYVSGFDTKVSEKLAGSNPNCRRIVAVITVVMNVLCKSLKVPSLARSVPKPLLIWRVRALLE